jgi:hypothetical protein
MPIVKRDLQPVQSDRLVIRDHEGDFLTAGPGCREHTTTLTDGSSLRVSVHGELRDADIRDP